MLWLILFGTLQVSAHFKLKLAVAVAVAVLDFGLGGDKSDGAFCQSIRDELRGAFYNCGPALIRARAKLWAFNFRRGRTLDTTPRFSDFPFCIALPTHRLQAEITQLWGKCCILTTLSKYFAFSVSFRISAGGTNTPFCYSNP